MIWKAIDCSAMSDKHDPRLRTTPAPSPTRRNFDPTPEMALERCSLCGHRPGTGSELPTGPGWYWFRHRTAGWVVAHVVREIGGDQLLIDEGDSLTWLSETSAEQWGAELVPPSI